MKNVYCRKSLYVRNTKKYEKYLWSISLKETVAQADEKIKQDWTRCHRKLQFEVPLNT
jgi:hypothetical protein